MTPLLFIGHGSPMNAIEDNEFSRGWKSVAATIPKPKAILCISAHWETKGTFVTSMEKPKTIHDFGGFPKELYEVEYPAPGSRELASEVQRSVSRATIFSDDKWGLDHGSWSVLRQMYPDADVPVVQLSLDYTKPPLYHYELAKELLQLRKKEILILGSGNMVHNLGLVAWDKMDYPGYGYDWALEAGNKMKSFILSGDHQSLIDYQKQGKEFSLAIPTPEHFLPLLYILGLKEENETLAFFNDIPVMGSLTMTSILISPHL